MGSSQSKSKPELTHKQLIERHGVLIPPSFAITGNGSCGSASSDTRQRTLSSHDRLPLTPSRVDYLTASNFGQGLLRDYMIPGMWVLAGGSVDGTATHTVRASLPQNSNGRISFATSPEQSSGSQVEMRTGMDGILHLFVTLQPLKNASLFYNVNTTGSGYVGGQMGLTLDKPGKPKADNLTEEDEEDPSGKIQFELGSWLPYKGKTGGKHLKELVQPREHICGFLSVGMLGSTAVVETKVNVNTLDTELSKYFSIQLNGDSTASQPTDAKPSPPLWLTMINTPQASTINISQLLTFDRLNLNILENKAPRVRNTFGWSVQLERPNDQTNDDGTPFQSSVAVAWQANRNIAFKMVGTSTQGTNATTNKYAMNCALLLKRWKQPRVTCSILGRADASGLGFAGIGIELETDASTLLGGNYYAPETAKVSDQDLPETKATLE